MAIRTLNLDIVAYENALRLEAIRVLKEAVIKYVQTASRQIPSLTGQARASVIAAAQSLGLRVGINPQSFPHSKDRAKSRGREIARGNTAERGYTLGGAFIFAQENIITLDITNILTSAHNDYSYIDQKALDEGLQELDKHVQANFTPPNPVRYITRGR